MRANESSVPDALFQWTTAAALIAFGVIFFDDAVIMGRTILALGVLWAANEGLKLRAVRTGSDRRASRFHLPGRSVLRYGFAACQ